MSRSFCCSAWTWFVALTTVSLWSCGCGVTSTAGTISIAPVGVLLTPKATVQLHALMTTPSGEVKDVTSRVSWQSSNLTVATVDGTGVLTTASTGQAAINASVANLYATSMINVVPSATGPVGTSPISTSPPISPSPISPSPIGPSPIGTSPDPYPIPVYTGVDLSSFPTFNVNDFGASGSGTSLNCSGKAGTTQLVCSGASDFSVGQGIRIVGAGSVPAEASITGAPVVTDNVVSATGLHTYCYVVFAVDPLGGITLPSPQTCVSNEPDLSMRTTSNNLSVSTKGGPSPTFLWYVSEDGAPFRLLDTDQFYSNSTDVGQRIGSRGGWPDNLPPGNPNIAKNQDLFSSVQLIDGDTLTITDPLVSSVESAFVDHDDTQAVQSAILAAVTAGGGNIVFDSGGFNLRRPAFSYVVDNSYAYPPYTDKLALDPWWARYSYLYIPNGAKGNISLVGAGRSTTLVTPPDHGGTASLLSMGREQRVGAVGTPILDMEEVAKGATTVTLKNGAEASTLAVGDDVFIYSGSFQQTPDIDTAGYPDDNHYSELNTVASVSGSLINLVYPTAKRYFNDGASSFGMTKLPVTPHNIELQHMNISTSEPITGGGDLFGLLVDDVQIQQTVSPGAFGGGYKRGVTIQNSQWSFGKGSSGWSGWDEYDQFTDLAFLNNKISGFSAPGSEGPSGMAKILATEGTSQLLFYANTFDHVAVTVDQTTECYVQQNKFLDGFVTAGVAYSPFKQYFSIAVDDRSFLSFDSQDSFSADHNTFNISADFSPPWVIRAGDFTAGNISSNTINYGGGSPWFVIGTLNGSVLYNTISVSSPVLGTIIELVPDQSSLTPSSSFLVQGNQTTAATIGINIDVKDAGFTDTAPLCLQNNLMQVSKGLSESVSQSVVNQACQ